MAGHNTALGERPGRLGYVGTVRDLGQPGEA
jgi:hypothetical protein